ncbi:asparagine synthase (glutamine-hydrolyzing) [Pseudohongiella acticola]|uniref:asparagine synthase (glutamine-hydrolyzing) n=1 Tax=Pseudohongiella acticola TaxID=1524254 RepID=A0A1E8CN28_9GAMM|nr:asparagine synthase (glutamine-hydrolyzing) [Pseudohongiella acticola]
MTHRGPDDEGEWWSTDGRVGLAHRRLAILDLSPAGHQPMLDRSSDLSIVFNGEIYNFRDVRKELIAKGHDFHSGSDTEVVLAAYREWGTKCLTHFNGMFAFAIYDAVRQTLFLARDRAGEKPLFYYHYNGELRFASELKALLADPDLPRQIDSDALDCYLSMGYIPGALCILKGYNKLPAAHALSFDLASGKASVWRYWQVPELSDDSASADETSLLDELESLLDDAVRLQMVADVPVGILLSGGVDSSLVTAMAVRHSSKVRTFSIGFSGHGELDETPHARLIARHFGTDHTELTAEPATAELMMALAQQFDEPMADSSMFPTWLVSHLVRQHCTVALGGDGGDELFGGYGHYSRLLVQQRTLSRVPKVLRHGFAQLAESVLPVGVKGRNFLQNLDVDLKCGLSNNSSLFDRTTRKKLLRAFSSHSLAAESTRRARVTAHEDLLQRATRFDFQDYLAEDILVKVDRASMLNSLEVRAPLLDYRLIEFAFGKVPSRLKATETEKKILLKRLTSKLLPPEFDRKRKQGFSIPMASWLKAGPFRELFWDTLTSADCMFDAVTVRGLLDGQDKGRSNGERLFALTQFELWRKTYGASL